MSKAQSQSDAKKAARALIGNLSERFEKKRYRTTATITNVQRDSAQRIIAAVATIDGLGGQTVQIDHGAPIAIGDVYQVENQGSETSTSWIALRRLRSASAVPPVGQPATLPTPGGLTVNAKVVQGFEGPVAYLYAVCNSVDDSFGILHFVFELSINDLDVPNERYTVIDTMETGEIQAAISASATVIPHNELYGSLSRTGRIKLESELIDYSSYTSGDGDSGTGTGSTNTLTDGSKTWTISEWVGYALVDSAGTIFQITANTATTLTVSGTPASGAYEIHPAFLGCTRAAGGSTATTHADNKTYIRRTIGAHLGQHPANTDYNIRVRTERPADGSVSPWSAWVTKTTPYDTIAPDAPAGLSTTSQPGLVVLTWTGPVVETTPDLAGFEVYVGLESDGSDATKVKTVGAVLDTGISCIPGITYYFNLKAFDNNGNTSAYGSSWVSGKASIGAGVQLLVNSDFTRDKDSDDEPDQWTAYGSNGTTVAHGNYGMNSGAGLRWTLPAYVSTAGTGIAYQVKLSSQSLLPIIPVEVGKRYTATIWFKTSLDPQYWHNEYSDPGTNECGFRVTPCTTNDSGIAAIQSDVGVQIIDQREDPTGTWYRLMTTRVLQQSDIEVFGENPDGSYMGLQFWVDNRHTSQVVIDIDRAQFEIDGPTDYQFNLVSPGGSSPYGLLIDSSGIRTYDGTFWLDANGKMYSDLLPDVTGTRNLGSSSLHWDVVYADSLVGGASHDPVSLAASAESLLGLTVQDISLDTQAANLIFAGPSSGGAAVPTFRTLVTADIPSIDHSTLANVTEDQHHPRVHAIVGSDHSASGLTTGYVIRATGASTFAWAQLQHTDLGGVDTDQHHSQQHALSGSDHTGDLAWSQIDSLVAQNAIALGTAAASGSASTLMRSDDTIAAFDDGTPVSVSLAASAPGSTAYAARTDHGHQLDVSIAPTWTGTHTFQATMTTRSLQPELTDTYDIGTYLKWYRQQFVSSINAVVFAEATQQLFGGYLSVVFDAGTFAAQVDSTDTTIDFGKAMTNGHFVLVRSHTTSGSTAVEYIQVGTLVSGTEYNVTRDLSSGNDPDPAWPEGTPFMVSGTTGTGRIDMVAYTGTGTPRISVMGQGSTYNDQREFVRMGNLDGGWDYISPVYGFAAGRYAAGLPNLTIDQTSGVRINRYTGATNQTLGQWNTSGEVLIGDQDNEHIKISSTSVQFIDNTTVYTDLTAGALTLGDSAGGEYVVIDSVGIDMFAGGTSTIKMWANSGDARFGTTAGGNMLWDADGGGSGQLLFRGGTTTQAYIDTDGTLTAGGGSVKLDSEGMTIIGSSSYTRDLAVAWEDTSGNEVAEIAGFYDSSTIVLIPWHTGPSKHTALDIYSKAASTSYTAQTRIGAYIGGSSSYQARVYLYAGSTPEALIGAGAGEITVTPTYTYINPDLLVNSGLWVGVSSGSVSNGVIVAEDYIVGKGGIRSGTVYDPGAGNISASGYVSTGGDGRFGGGVRAGSTADVVDGNVEASNYMRSAGGITLGSTTLAPGTGDVLYTGQLNSYKNSSSYEVFGYYELTSPLTSTSWDGNDNKSVTSNTTIDLNTTHGLPAGVAAVYVRCTAMFTTESASTLIAFRAYNTDTFPVMIRAYTSGMYFDAMGIIPVNSSGQISYKVQGATANNVALEIHGYFI